MAKSKAKLDYSTSSDGSQKYTLGYTPSKSDGQLRQIMAKIYPDDPDYEYESSMGMDKSWTPENPYINGDSEADDWDMRDTVEEAGNAAAMMYSSTPSMIDDSYYRKKNMSAPGQYYNMPHRSKGYTPKNEAKVKPLVEDMIQAGGAKQSREEFTTVAGRKFMEMLEKSKEKQDATPKQLYDYARKYADSTRNATVLEDAYADDYTPGSFIGYKAKVMGDNKEDYTDGQNTWEQDEIAAKKAKARRKKK